MPLFRRCDGELVKNIDPIRRLMPLVIHGRNESIIYHTTQWRIAKAGAGCATITEPRGFENIVSGPFTPVLAKHTKSFNLVAKFALENFLVDCYSASCVKDQDSFVGDKLNEN
jgi:hypothetical protein